MTAITVDSMESLLALLDPENREKAGEEYILLHEKLAQMVVWKGCSASDADYLADRTLNLVAGKTVQTKNIVNVKAFAFRVMHFMWLEHRRKKREDTIDAEHFPEIAVEPDVEILKDTDTRLECLRKCMTEVIPNSNDKLLIVEYYGADGDEKNKEKRRALAEKLGLTMTNLKVKACRLRDRLEKCINDCVDEISVTDSRSADTSKQRGKS